MTHYPPRQVPRLLLPLSVGVDVSSRTANVIGRTTVAGQGR